MNLKKTYYLSTSLYILIGLFGFYFLLISVFNRGYFLAVISVLITFVAFDNVFCKSRKKVYSVK